MRLLSDFNKGTFNMFKVVKINRDTFLTLALSVSMCIFMTACSGAKSGEPSPTPAESAVDTGTDNTDESTPDTTSKLSLYPLKANIVTDTGVVFSVSGGTPPYSFNIDSGGGSMVANAYHAPASPTTAKITLKDSTGATLSAVVKVRKSPASVSNTPTIKFSIFRLYNSKKGDHLYSTSKTEGTGHGYKYQHVAFKLYGNGGGAPVFRCLTYKGKHYLSLDLNCEGGYLEGFMGYASPNGLPAIPVYRFISRSGDILVTKNYTEGLAAGYFLQGTLMWVPAN